MNDKVKQAVLDHFREWSGGFEPEENNDERCRYVEYGRLTVYAKEEVGPADLYEFLGVPTILGLPIK